MIAPLLLAAAVTFPASFGGPWTAWHDVRVLPIPARSTPAFVRVPLSGVDTGQLGGYPSVRIVDDTGTEAPYALDPDRATPPDALRALPLSDTGFVRGAYSQAVADLGASPFAHEAVRIETSRKDFLLRASVETSDDRATWQLVRSDALIYRVGGVADVGSGPAANPVDLTVSYPPSHARWVRVRVYDPASAFEFQAIRLETKRAPALPFETVARTSVAVAGDAPHTQRFDFDFGPAFAAVDAVSVSGGNAEYARTISVESSDDGTTWTGSATDEPLVRTKAQSAAIVVFGKDNGQKFRVTIGNANNAPMTGLTVALLAVPHDIVFRALPGRSYALLSGNPVALSPDYELGELLARRDWHADVTVHGPLASPVANVDYADPRSLTERVPWLVDAGFVVASLIVGALALQTLRGAKLSSRAEPPKGA